MAPRDNKVFLERLKKNVIFVLLIINKTNFNCQKLFCLKLKNVVLNRLADRALATVKIVRVPADQYQLLGLSHRLASPESF